MLILLLLLQDAPLGTIPENHEIIGGPFFDGKSVRFLARDAKTGHHYVQAGKTVLEFEKPQSVGVRSDESIGAMQTKDGAWVLSGQRGIEVLTEWSLIDAAYFGANGEVVGLEAKKGKKYYVVLRTEKIEVPEGGSVKERRRDSGKTTVAYVLQAGAKQYVVAEKHKGPMFEAVDTLLVSPDGKSVMYKARIATDEFLMAESKKISGYSIRDLGFTPQSDPWWVAAIKLKEGGVGETALFVAGKKGASIRGESVGVAFAPDGKTPILRAAWDDAGQRKWYLVFGNKIFPEHELIDTAVASADSKNVAYRVKSGTNSAIVVNDKMGAKYDDLALLCWSPNGKTVGYAAKFRTSWYAVEGEKKSEAYDSIQWLGFHPKTNRLVYIGATAEKKKLVDGDVASQEFLSIGPPQFAQDGTIMYECFDGTTNYVVIGTEFAERSSSPISTTGGPAYKLMDKGKTFLRFKDGRSETFDSIDKIVWGSSCLYLAKDGTKSVICVGKTRLALDIDQVYEMRFSADGKKVEVGYRKGQDLHWSVQPLP